jgi:replicative DNA helicase
MRKLDKQGQAIDFVSLSNELPDMNEEIMALISDIPSSFNYKTYETIVKTKANARNVLAWLERKAQEVNRGTDAQEIDFTPPDVYGNEATNEVNVKSIKAQLDFQWANPHFKPNLLSPWNGFNVLTDGGIKKNASTLIKGQSGIGKTTFGIQYALFVARGSKKWVRRPESVVIYSLEMTEYEVMMRILSIMTGIRVEAIEKNRGSKDSMTASEKVKLSEALKELEGLNIRISDATHWSSQSIRADLTKMKDKPTFVLIDYLGKLKDKAESSHVAVEKASSTIKDIAKDLGITILTIASETKDGSLKGTAETLYAQDAVYRIIDADDQLLPYKRKIFSDKVRFGKMSGQPAIVYQEEDLPKLSDTIRSVVSLNDGYTYTESKDEQPLQRSY